MMTCCWRLMAILYLESCKSYTSQCIRTLYHRYNIVRTDTTVPMLDVCIHTYVLAVDGCYCKSGTRYYYLLWNEQTPASYHIQCPLKLYLVLRWTLSVYGETCLW